METIAGAIYVRSTFSPWREATKDETKKLVKERLKSIGIGLNSHGVEKWLNHINERYIKGILFSIEDLKGTE